MSRTRHAAAKAVPQPDVCLCNLLLNNQLHIKIILMIFDWLAIPDQREQKCLTNY
jgi:hypothetical protein